LVAVHQVGRQSFACKIARYFAQPVLLVTPLSMSFTNRSDATLGRQRRYVTTGFKQVARLA
jgi:hypothetical protein